MWAIPKHSSSGASVPVALSPSFVCLEALTCLHKPQLLCCRCGQLLSAAAALLRQVTQRTRPRPEPGPPEGLTSL